MNTIKSEDPAKYSPTCEYRSNLDIEAQNNVIAHAITILDSRIKRGNALTSPQDVRNYLKLTLSGRECEYFGCLFLDNRHQAIAFEEMFRGTIDGASVHPREVVKSAITHNAAAVILAHNHPSGLAAASQADQRITQRLKDALALIDIRVLDHIIVGDGEPVSMAELGQV